MKPLLNNIYKGKKVFLTGHTGFKGSWMALWLKELGAEVYGYSLEPISNPNHYDILNLDIHSTIGDIRDLEFLKKEVHTCQPDIIFHLAAQALVRYSYLNPLETLQTNTIGVANIFEAARSCSNVKAIINVTTDKCYENKEQVWGYREIDPLGGYDPYSASKACSEIITSSYRNSFFNLQEYNINHQCLVASARAGNVIGGGDWAQDRLIPDIVRAIESDQEVEIRSPRSTRPWQHVLEPIWGYLMLGEKLLSGDQSYASAWNFGPSDESIIDVEEVVTTIKKYWDAFQYKIDPTKANLHEASLLKLDVSKAHAKLNWKSIWGYEETFKRTIFWYKQFLDNKNVQTRSDLMEFDRQLRQQYQNDQ